jgi:type I restriction enzyme S subunit
LEEPYCNLRHIGPENIRSETGTISAVRTAKELRLVSGKYLFDDEAIVYAKIRPNLNKVCLPSFSGLCSADAYALWPRLGVVTREYLAQFMRSELFVRQAVAVSMRTGLPKINRQDLNRLEISVPPLEQQRRIAEVLRVWDRATQEVGSAIRMKTELKRALAQQLLTGKRRFPEFIESSGSEETLYGLIPRDWQYVEIGDVARHVTARQGDRAGLPVLSCTKHFGLVDSAEYFDRQVHSRDTSSYKVVQRGQFAYATNHIEEGSIGLLTHRDAGLVSPMYTVFEVSSMILASFLFALLKTETYLHIFRIRTSSSVNRRGSLRWKDFSRIHVPVPSLPEQERIAAVLSSVDRKIKLLCSKLRLLRKQKRGLMQKLLTGEIRVLSGGE